MNPNSTSLMLDHEMAMIPWFLFFFLSIRNEKDNDNNRNNPLIRNNLPT